MLNELEAIRRGLTNAGIQLETEHPDVQPVGKNKRFVLVRLGPTGAFAGIELLSAQLAGRLWTFREGKHNSFPAVSLPPLLHLSDSARRSFIDQWKKEATVSNRRTRLCQAITTHPTNNSEWNNWPGKGLLQSLRRKQAGLVGIEMEAAAIPEVLERFLAIFDTTEHERRHAFVNELAAALAREVKSGVDDWVEIGRLAFVGEEKKGSRNRNFVGGDFYFDVVRSELPRDVHDPRNRVAAARALSASSKTDSGSCAITGQHVELHRGNFPQINLPALGLSFLFSKNNDLLAAGSYGRFGHEAFPIGRVEVGELKSAIDEVVSERRENITWCRVPGERRKTTDLLIAFVEGAPDAPTAGLIAGDGGEPDDDLDPVAAYERRAERLLEAVRGKAPDDFRQTPVQVCLVRKVDEGNRKILFHRHLTVEQLYACAREWMQAQRNLPEWMFLQHRGRRSPPQSLTPLSIPSLTRRQFLRRGAHETDAIGLSAAEAFSLFLREGDERTIAQRLLHMALKRHRQLLEAAAHDKHGARASGLDTSTALHVLTLLAISLHVLGRRGGSWMNDVAFRLGQLLSVADVVHAGYCADVRRGQLPPALLGNTVLTMAQANPAKALAMLARRWKPYASWATRVRPADAARLRNSQNRDESDRGWKISQAIWQYRRAAEICSALHGKLPETANDIFRAELLLGYVAGLPPVTRGESDDDDQRREDEDNV